MSERVLGKGRETEIVSKSDIKREMERWRDGKREGEVDKRGNQSINESITGHSVPRRLLRSSQTPYIHSWLRWTK